MEKSLKNAAENIVKVLERLVSNEKGWNPLIYIGKTNNEQRREKEHKEGTKPLVYFTLLAEGNADKINELEKLSIELSEKSKILKMKNVNEGGGGNLSATKLYVAFSEPVPNDVFGEYEFKLLGNEFPITL